MPRTNENVSTVNSSQKARVAHETSLPQPYRGKYIYLKGRYNRSLREISELKAELRSYNALLAEYRKLETAFSQERRLRELFQKETHYYMGVASERTGMLIERTGTLIDYLIKQ